MSSPPSAPTSQPIPRRASTYPLTAPSSQQTTHHHHHHSHQHQDTYHHHQLSSPHFTDDRTTNRIHSIHPITTPTTSLPNVSQQSPNNFNSSLPQHQQEMHQLMNVCSDFLSLFRTNDFAYEWIFDYILNHQSDDISNVDVSLARGFRSIHLCGLRGCASNEYKTILLNTSTLLIPVQSKGTVVAGYFIDSCQEKSTSNIIRDGKYIYCSTSRELIKVFRIQEQTNLNDFYSLCLTRTILLDQAMLTIDYTMISLPWQQHTTSNLLQLACIVHSRTLSLHRLVQPAQQDNITFNNQTSSLHHSDSMTQNEITQNSFYGIGTFGVYQSAILPSKLATGMRSQHLDHSVPLSIGNWALPQHIAVCTSHQYLRLGIMSREAIDLKAHFVNIYNNQGIQFVRRISNSIDVNNFVEHTENLSKRDDPSLSENAVYSTTSPPSNFSYPKEIQQQSSTTLTRTNLSQRDLNTNTASTSLFIESERNNNNNNNGSELLTNESRAITRNLGNEIHTNTTIPSSTTTIPTIPTISTIPTTNPKTTPTAIATTTTTTATATTPILPYQPLAISSQAPFTTNDIIHQRVDDIPSSVVDSLEATVIVGPHHHSHSQQQHQQHHGCNESMKRTRSLPSTFNHSTSKYTPIPIPPPSASQSAPQSAPPPPTNTSTTVHPTPITPCTSIEGNRCNTSDMNYTKKEENTTILLPSFKKTLPAPTKSEIVIRNRISAQRSNEKRRRKIEATKCELAYLKSTYLPQLRQKRTCLVSENQNLRLQFMERYNESDVESFM